jgi:hypothetical protein
MEGVVLTIALLLIAVTLAGFGLTANARRRAEREAAATALERARVAQRKRVPVVSNNVKGVTASQTISPLRSTTSASDQPSS